MSGIAALIRFDGEPVEPGLIEAMARSMAHRGPDGVHWRRLGSVALAHCMLCTTPQALDETQPLANEDGTVVLAMDGRLDNWEELRADLAARGARLRDRTDAELVLRSYEHWGRDCTDHLDGDFALIVWDARRAEAFCARDRMGHKPFHYHWDGSRLAVASELHAILALPWVSEELNEGLIAERLADDFCSLDETLWKGILRLPAAHRMTVDAGGPRAGRYWGPNLDAELRYRREEDYVEHYRTLLEDVIRRQSRSHKPLACEVSGGLDSSAVFAMSETLRRRGELLAPGVEAYTLRFEGGAASRDLPHARAVGAHLGCAVHEIAPTCKPLEWYRAWAARYRDLPGAPNGVMQLGIGEAAVARGSRVLLGGFGGDQWLGGDHTYFAGSLAQGRWGEAAASLGRDARAYGLRHGLFLAARYGAVPLLPHALRQWGRRVLARGGAAGGADRLGPSLAEALSERRRLRPVEQAALQRPVHRQKLRYLASAWNIWAYEVMETQAASLGLERRSPLDSPAVAQFGFSVPQHWLLRGGRNRYIHSRAMSGLLPDSLTRRQDKAEFSIVFDWLRPELERALDEAASGSPEPWISRDALARSRASSRPDRSANPMSLWLLFTCAAVRQGAEEARGLQHQTANA